MSRRLYNADIYPGKTHTVQVKKSINAHTAKQKRRCPQQVQYYIYDGVVNTHTHTHQWCTKKQIGTKEQRYVDNLNITWNKTTTTSLTPNKFWAKTTRKRKSAHDRHIERDEDVVYKEK